MHVCLATNCIGFRVKIGQFVRKSDGQRIQRWRCNRCKKNTSDALKSPCYRQNKRHLNSLVAILLCSAVSQRRIALILKISRLTVSRKFEFLCAQAKIKNEQYVSELFSKERVKEIFMDEMEDRVHTKCKPVAIALAVNAERKILGVRVSQMRPKNRKLNQISKRKYPKWIPNLENGFESLLLQIRPYLDPEVKIKSDEKYFYSKLIKKVLPKSQHIRFKSRSAVISGQGELKEGGRDPLFQINHTCASLRANINRMIRRTWCTSKKIENLQKHIELYQSFHNLKLT